MLHLALPTMTRAASPRRGMVLLVVMSLLAIFAVVAISFVFYADSQALASNYHRHSLESAMPDVDPELLHAYFLQQLLFDVRDDAGGVASALRGHGLMRSTWGSAYELNSDGSVTPGNNTVAYNGTGRLHQTYPAAAPLPLRNQDDYKLINYTYFSSDGFLRDPERLGLRGNPTSMRGTFTGGFNPPYTYPDLNNVYLAAVKADGTLLAPSYHRPWLFGPLDPSNPNWTNAQGKYLLLRPRPAEHPPLNGKPGFPFPEDATGDVKNLMGPGGNDSFWLDLGFPVLTHTDGRKFKPMFAAAVIELDGRVNLNVHGNIRGANGNHASNQGWGPWEVSLARVAQANTNEWKNLYRGEPGPTPRVWGRYGPDRQPTPTPLVAAASFGRPPHFFGQVDFDGCRPNGQATLPFALPGGTQCFPTYPAGYDNANLAERTNHPSLYHIAGPLGQQDRRFSPAHLEALLRHGDTGSPALSSDLAGLCPQNFADPRFRRLVTTLSNDLRRPGLSPWHWDMNIRAWLLPNRGNINAPEKLVNFDLVPKPYPAFANVPTLYDEFDRAGRGGEIPLTRVDVNRPLPNYPTPNAAGRITDVAGFQTAHRARQLLARDIFMRLVKATGAYDPARFLGPPDLRTLRWLAQWSVNMVDFIDGDEYSTPFPWAKLAGSPAFANQNAGEWVFGVEMPRVLLNETYAEFVNQVGETGKGARATQYHVNLWVELFNPLRTDGTLPNSGDVQLDGAYQLIVTAFNRNLLSGTDFSNMLGDPDNTSATQRYDANQVHTILDRFKPARVPASDKPSQGFYVAGPPHPVPGVNAWNPGSSFGNLRSTSLNYQVPVGANPVAVPRPPSVLLRRLACPALPWQPNASLDTVATPYNPYVTVDYVETVELNRGITNNGRGLFGQPTPLNLRRSSGRDQPFNGHPQYHLEQYPVPAQTSAPQHTLSRHNQDNVFNPREPFDWFVHLDRPLISPMELIHTASCRPHQVTRLFKDTLNDGYQRFNHAPYWLLRDGASPLHRAFELLETSCRAGGAASIDRVPGKINVNAIWDPETFLALCDPQRPNYFDANDVTQIYRWLLANRSPAGAPGAGDRPFKSFTSAHFTQSGNLYGEGNGIEDTFFRANPLHPKFDAAKRPIRLFEVVKKDLFGETIAEHPSQRYELMTKIFNNVTTRSHVFAVWLTVGFFEVNDENSRPVRLGAEIGRAEGRQVRHRMFALVDRSAPVRILPAEGQPALTSGTPVNGAGPAVVFPSQMSDPNASYRWSIQPGMVLRVTGLDASGTPASEEVMVSAISPNSFIATFSRAYPRGFTSITAYGNPGPRMTPFNPARYPELVPLHSVIR